jgi:hypothetical protein
MGKKKQPKMLLVVRGDYNDADFVTDITPITQKQLDRLLPLFEAIKNFKPYMGCHEDDDKSDPKNYTWKHDHNWGVGEYGYRKDLGAKSIYELYQSEDISKDLIQEFQEEYVPNGGEQAGYSLHTIVEIFVVKLDQTMFINSNHYKNWSIL